MASDGQPIERLREYLRTLSPKVRSMLIQELERCVLRGEDSPGNDLVLQELRRAIRADAQPVPRIGNAARLFFTPVEPFLIDGRADHKRIGRLARVSLEPIWAWIGRDLMPAEAKALSEDLNRALLAGDRSKADQLASALHDRAVQRMREAVAMLDGDEKARRRLSVQVGTPRALEDVSALTAALSLREQIADLSGRLPQHIGCFEHEQIDVVKSMLDEVNPELPSEEGNQRPSLFLFGLILVISRLTAPWQLIRLAIRAAESGEAAIIAGTPYAAAVTLVLGETENTVGELRAELKAGRPIASLLKALHEAVHGLRSELNMDADSPWSKQLATIRAEISALLKSDIETAPGIVRRLLRPRAAKDITPDSVLDAVDVDEAEMRVEFVCACRHYANELAVNEATLRAHADLTLYLEPGTKVLLDSLRHAGDADRRFRQSQVDAAIRFCRVMFGADYASHLAESAEGAMQSLRPERKAAVGESY
jgi:hypothetical protein